MKRFAALALASFALGGSTAAGAPRTWVGTLRLPVIPEYLAMGDHKWSSESGEKAVERLMALSEPPSAIVAASDTLTLGTLRALRRTGRRVPEDVALVSFDDPLDGDLLDPPVTALARHYRELGELGAGLLLDALRGAEPAGPTAVRVPLELIVRASCGCSA